jgi:hypothetical protein
MVSPRRSLTVPLLVLALSVSSPGCSSTAGEGGGGADATDVADAAGADGATETAEPDGGGPDASPFGWPQACETCLYERCWASADACAKDATCAANLGCEAACTAPSCWAGCLLERDAAQETCVDADTTRPYNAAYDDYWGCLYDECEADCGMGTTWACVGDYAWPPIDGGADAVVAITYHAVDFINPGKGVDGATVSACARADVDCAAPIATATTDADGYACLEVPIGDSGFTGYFRLSHEDYVTIDDQYGRPIFYGMTVYMDAISIAASDMFFTSEGIELDPARGLVTVTMFDCSWNWAPDVIPEISSADGQTASFFVTQGGGFSFALTQTTGYGTGAFVNVPADGDPARVLVRLAETQEIVGCHDVTPRPGVRTNLRLNPYYEGAFGCPDGLP